MQEKKKYERLLFTAIVLLSAGADTASAQKNPTSKLEQVMQVMKTIEQGGSPTLRELVKDAPGVAIIPRIFTGKFIFAGLKGSGVFVRRGPDGRWSNPAFVGVDGGSAGIQIGFESLDLVVVFSSEEAIGRLIRDKLELTARGDLSFRVGRLGGRAHILRSLSGDIEGHVVRSWGLLAGASFEGSILALRSHVNRRFYESSATGALTDPDEATPEAALAFLDALSSATNSQD